MAKVLELPYIPPAFDLEPEILDQLSSRPGSQRCVVGRDELLLIVHDMPRPGSSEREPLVFWRRDEGVWIDSQGNRGLRRLAELTERFHSTIRNCEMRIEEVHTAAEVYALARLAGPLARSSRNLATAIDQALAQDEDSRELRSLRDRMKEVERAAEMLYQDARLTLEFWQVERIEKQQSSSERLYQMILRLNLLLVFFLPLIAMAGLFGMNIPNAWLFVLVFLISLGLGAGLVVAFFKNINRRF